ncbi:MAG: hypothetical protein IJ105_00665 [Bacilli bacterium]|nr:hypothetical protein [Bacilli bacterium]
MKKVLFVILSFCIIFLPMNSVKADNNTFIKGVVTGSGVSVRTGPSKNYSLVKNDINESIYLSKPESVEVLGSTNGWYQIKFLYSGFIYTGYISADYLRVTTVTIDNSYKNSLMAKGFPESYAEKLTKLHALHPNWNFIVSNTNLNWNDAVNGEATPVSKNQIQSTNATLRSTEDGAYSNGTYTQYGTGWYAASKQTIGYFMDPRNFLDEGHIFMFEALDYSSSNQDVSTIQNMLNGSFMSGSFNYNNQSWTYANTFLTAGSQNNINPIHLVSRILLEQGSTCTALTCGTGYNGNYVGYYNFFNVGASGNSDYDIIISGLRHAYNKGWNNQYLSIVNGSATISNDYIARGQSTLYYQKFNTITPSYYINQYMQNVKAPYTEAYSTYTSYYNSNLLDSAFTFKIPVYNNMPDATTLSTSENATNTLSSLSISNCELSPSFTSSATSYTCNVDESINFVEVKATKTSAYSTVKGTGNISLTSDNNRVVVSVTAANGNVRDYVVTIKKIQKDISKVTPADIISYIGYNNNSNVLSKITEGTDISNIISNIKDKYSQANVIIKDKNNNQKTKGKISTNDKIIITINNQTIEYSTVIYGDVSGDGIIDITDLLKVQKHIKNVSVLSGNYLTGADTDKNGNVDIIDLLKVQKHIKGIATISQ